MSVSVKRKPVSKLNLQQGMVLLLCMIFLTAMMLLGLSASADTILQKQLVSNLQESEQVKQTAHATLLKAEQWLLALDNPEPQLCSQACTQPAIYARNHLPENPEHKPYSWWLEHGRRPNATDTASESMIGESSDITEIWLIDSVFRIDDQGQSRVWYRVLGRASNRTGTIVSVVESLFLRSWTIVDASLEGDGNMASDCFELANCGRTAWRRLR